MKNYTFIHRALRFYRDSLIKSRFRLILGTNIKPSKPLYFDSESYDKYFGRHNILKKLIKLTNHYDCTETFSTVFHI